MARVELDLGISEVLIVGVDVRVLDNSESGSRRSSFRILKSDQQDDA